MISNNFKMHDELNEPKASAQRRVRRKLAWPVIAFIASVMMLGASLGAFAGPPPESEQGAVVQYATNFSIIRVEDRKSDQVSVTFAKKGCSLSGVHGAVAFHYKQGASATVVQFSPKWTCGETKIFTNGEFREGPIQKVEFWGTARENVVKDGKIVATRVTFATQKTF